MRETALVIFVTIMMLILIPPVCAGEEGWSGVDETVIEKFAAAAGREARTPLINTDKGDLLLFCFALAGALGGFAAGYFYQKVFGKKESPPESGPYV